MTENIEITAMIECKIEIPDWLRSALMCKQVEAAQPKPKSIDNPLSRTMTDPMGVYTEQLAEFIKAAGKDGATRQEIDKSFRYRLTNKVQRDIALSKLPKGFEKRNERFTANNGKRRSRHRWFYVGS